MSAAPPARGPRFTLLLCTVISALVTAAAAAADEDGVCKSIDVRNNVSNLQVLENCTVIEGHLKIVLIDKGQPHQYENYSFPKLREITDYLLLYRAFGLQSVGKLFPNLAVIRGRQLFTDYALAIYDMQLQQIGLSNLTTIARGSVRIESNPKLCYVDTIDWDTIARAGKGGHFIKDNRPPDECENCGKIGDHQCPTRSRKDDGKLIGDKYGRLCWNNYECQKICKLDCEKRNLSCTVDGNFCCHENCLGGCVGKTPKDCLACRKFKINEEQCKNLSTNKVKYKLFFDEHSKRKQCLEKCPLGFKEGSDHTCVTCQGPCPKVCDPTIVNSIADAQSLRGCTEIKGPLIISIEGRGANVIKELEESLKDLEVITDYLKVTRSYPLISLHFLKNLRLIKGVNMDRSNYSLLVFDNQNLQQLFTFNASGGKNQLIIEKGRIFFHLNPKLCVRYIDELKNYAQLKGYPDGTWSDDDVSPFSNGEKVPCEVLKLNVTVQSITSDTVLLKWENFKRNLIDQRALIGYLIYYKETKFQNVTRYSGRDACSSSGWEEKQFDDLSDEKEDETHIIPNLKPYTQYALFIKTTTIQHEKKGAISDIIYFTTKPSTPDKPTDLKATSISPNEIMISWGSPKNPNGIIKFYKVRGTKEPGNVILGRNYCYEPLSYVSVKKNFTQEPTTSLWTQNVTSQPTKNNECCSCKKSIEENQDEKSSRISFEDAIINLVFVRREERRRRRSISAATSAQNVTINESKSSTRTNDSANENDSPLVSDYFETSVYQHKQVAIQNLSHFSEYNIEVQACHEQEPEGGQRCSKTTITYVRTLPLGGADDIDERSIVFQTENITSNLIVRWDEPVAPNGVIVSYDIEYKRLSSETTEPNIKCISHKSYSENRGIRLTDLRAGNYSFRLRATSLSGSGNWTSYRYYDIPSKEQKLTVIILSAVFGLAFILCLIGSVSYYVVRRKLRSIPGDILYASVNPEYQSAGYAYEPDEWEVPREKVNILREVGHGSFGKVYEGELIDYIPGEPVVMCAIKTVTADATHRDKYNFLQEATTMKAFNCHHVVKLLGVVSIGEPVYVLMEIMSNGDLRTYLRSLRSDEEGGKGLLPVRWMAPESLKDGVFTSQSDVWSYGIVLWEIATLASQPYQGLSNEQVLKYVMNGGCMTRPENCPERLYDLMCMCWEARPKARPTFTEIIETLLPDITDPKFKEKSFYHTQRPQMLQKKVSLHEEINSSTPLKHSCDAKGDDNSDSEETSDNYTVQYFPSLVHHVPETFDEECVQIERERGDNDHDDHQDAEVTNDSNVNTKMLNENSKSIPSSDGSKGSKVSNATSNGSIANGHILRYNTTPC
ncbi:insulin receptor-like protein [Dinothrombium tinctorium]|uniref:receptor protein-tyrosine kinase n=1 Tax=Dinothrombium tinctorium TaxID=1965070 RepID=A0A443QZ17_9ACAR|nr:insulin receptor-like protein [Dinothrombium tinctorium]